MEDLSKYIDNKIDQPKYIKDYIDKFGEEPITIGIFWNNEIQYKKNIENAIKTSKKYNELDLLTDSEKKLYNKGELFF